MTPDPRALVAQARKIQTVAPVPETPATDGPDISTVMQARTKLLMVHAMEDLAALVARVETLERFVATWDAWDAHPYGVSAVGTHANMCILRQGTGKPCSCGLVEMRTARAALEE